MLPGNVWLARKLVEMRTGLGLFNSCLLAREATRLDYRSCTYFGVISRQSWSNGRIRGHRVRGAASAEFGAGSGRPGPVDGCPGSRATSIAPQKRGAHPHPDAVDATTYREILRRHYGQRQGRVLQIISPSARTGFGVPSTGGGGTSTALTVASGADSITVTSPISIPFTSATGSPLRRR